MIGQTRISVAAWTATVLGAIVLVPVFSGPFLFVSALRLRRHDRHRRAAADLARTAVAGPARPVGGAGRDAVGVLPARHPEVRRAAVEGHRAGVQRPDGRRARRHQPLQRTAATGVVLHPVRGQRDRADRPADPPGRRTVPAGGLGRPAVAADVHGACGNGPRRAAGTAVHPARARLHRAAVGRGQVAAGTLGPPDRRRDGDGCERADRGVGGRPGRPPDRPHSDRRRRACYRPCCQPCPRVCSATACPATDPGPASAARCRWAPTRCSTWAGTYARARTRSRCSTPATARRTCGYRPSTSSTAGPGRRSPQDSA